MTARRQGKLQQDYYAPQNKKTIEKVGTPRLPSRTLTYDRLKTYIHKIGPCASARNTVNPVRFRIAAKLLLFNKTRKKAHAV
jgi:hypothetical protein